MNRLSNIKAPADFEENLAVRMLLASMPSVDAPASFEANVERRIAAVGVKRSIGRAMWWIGGLSIVGISVWIGSVLLQQPEPVEISETPQAWYRADLENLPPVVVSQDKRWDTAGQKSSHKRRIWTEVVAGR
jgi:hypothetical protein